jgi:anti-sigma regulatory factor (Ser/Thr protein kinase)
VSLLSTHDSFIHEAFLYDDDNEFFARTVPFIDDGVAGGDAVLVVLDRGRIDRLRSMVSGPENVQFEDMAEVGHNPGRLISAWVGFVAENVAKGRRIRGIGEPIWRGRSEAEILECQRHEALLNVAFESTPGLTLICPYDRSLLDERVLDTAGRTHPTLVRDGGRSLLSPDYEGPDVDPFTGDLPEPSGVVEEFVLAGLSLDRVRRLVADYAAAAGLDSKRSGEFVVAVNEAVTNTVRHADGIGVLRLWREGHSVICDVVDHGWIQDPLAGRLPVSPTEPAGRGLWIIHQLCDLVQVRSSETSTIVRMHLYL